MSGERKGKNKTIKDLSQYAVCLFVCLGGNLVNTYIVFLIAGYEGRVMLLFCYT